MKPKQIKDHTGIVSSVFAIILGLIVGLIILFLCNREQALPGFATILTGAFTHGSKGIGQVFYYATPIILTGLSVGFAFKTGLFNIGTPGQFIMGGFGAVYVGILWTSLGPVHWIAALAASVILGALWGLVPGILKAYYNVNEVIASIMMNYIGMYLVNWITKSYKPLFNNLRNESKNVAATANIPKMGLDKIFQGSSVNGGIIIAILVVILIWVVLNKTTFGYELKAVGFNRDASKYAGINEKRSIILSMVIAGAIAGLAGGLLFLAGTGKHIEIKDVLPSEGFTGISVALLGLNNPIGVLFSGIFIAYLTAGGFYLQLFEFSTEIIDIIVAVIIYFSAFALMVKIIMSKLVSQKNTNSNETEKGGTKS
ncbi:MULTISPECIES: ABC transporter permease [Lacrimispora]|jgi:simple sugar transport system permease protein|uniref:ABC transporter permease n=1 Tax=Lacrimispora TaxID=2719231 RepID=UPI000BE414F1|nr:ABC transporter permease [Lacrimispora amygdalina]MDK2966873.1 ral nucleoside transport system permease protein [Lacrimispora sp.]